MKFTATRRPLIAGSALAIMSALGIATNPSGAVAQPFPLAPPCNGQWGFLVGENSFQTKAGPYDMSFQAGGPVLNNVPTSLVGPDRHGMAGYLNGSMSGATFHGSFKSEITKEVIFFEGTIDENQHLQGTADFTDGNNHPSTRISPSQTEFFGGQSMLCQEASPPPQQQQPQQPQQQQQQAPPPQARPHDAIALSYGTFGANGLPVTVKNSSSVSGTCTYDSTPFDFHKDFNVAANNSTTFDISGIPTGTTYNVKVSCTGDFNGATVVIGQVNTTKKF